MTMPDFYSSFDEEQNPEAQNQQEIPQESEALDFYSAFDENQQEQPENPPEKTTTEKAARLASQFAMGTAEAALLPYEIATIPLASKDAMHMIYREQLMDELDNLTSMKFWGGITPEQEERLAEVEAQIKDFGRSEQYAEPIDMGIRSLTEQATGIDLKPEGWLEKGMNFLGFIKDPKKTLTNIKNAVTPKDFMKAIMPTAKEGVRSVAVGGALQAAENGEYGPIGTMAAMITADLMANAAVGGAKLSKKIIQEPKQTIAGLVAKFTGAEKKQLQKEIIESFRQSDIQADLGTITDSSLIKWTQARIQQSGLIGKELDEFKRNLFEEIKESYKKVAEGVGEARKITNYEVGSVAKETINEIRTNDLNEVRELYKEANSELKPGEIIDSSNVKKSADAIMKDLTPGSLKSEETKKVLNIIETLEKDLIEFAESGKQYSDPQALINSKIALNDIINYEVQGGQKKLLKGLVGEIDRALINHGKRNAKFGEKYIQANKRFSQHAKTFRNKEITTLLKESDPTKLLNRMDTTNGILKLKSILSKTPEGKKVFNELKRLKLDQMFENSMINNTSQQAKLGTFSKVGAKTKDAEILRQLLGRKAYRKLTNIQKNAGLLDKSAQEFFNASKTAAVATDGAMVFKLFNDVTHLVSGNPFPLVKSVGSLMAMKRVSRLLSDPEFLTLVEDVIITQKSGDKKKTFDAMMALLPYAKEVSEQVKSKVND